MLNDEKRGIEEAYTSAMATSDLRVEAEVRGDADVIIASGWSQMRIGGAILRLHTEFDSTPKPRMLEAEYFLPPGKATKDQRKHANKQAHEFNLNQMGLFLERLKALSDVRGQVVLQLVKWSVEDAEAKAVEIIRWWLHQCCPVCNGTKFQVVEGTGRHNGKACRECHGTGKREAPHGQVGRRAATWMDQCVERNRASIGRRVFDRQQAEAVRDALPVRPDGAKPRVFLRPPKQKVAQTS